MRGMLVWWLVVGLGAPLGAAARSPKPRRMWKVGLRFFSGQPQLVVGDGRRVYFAQGSRFQARAGRSGRVVWRSPEPAEELCADEPIDLQLATGRLFGLRACRDRRERGPGEPRPAPRSSLLVLDASRGRLLWTMSGTIPAPLAAGGERLFLVRDGALLALAAGTGRLLWKTPVAGKVFLGPAAADGRVLVQTEDGRVEARTAGSGALQWSRELAAAPRVPLAIGEGMALALRVPSIAQGREKAVLTGLSLADGRVLWQRELAGETGFAAPLLSGGRAFLVTDGQGFSGRLRAFEAGSGRLLWQRPADCSTVGHDCRPVSAPGGLLVWSARLADPWKVPGPMWLEQLDPATGRVRTARRFAGPEKMALSRPAAGAGFVVFSPGERLVAWPWSLAGR